MSDYAMTRRGSSRSVGHIWPVRSGDESFFLLNFGHRTEVQSFALSPSGSLWLTVAARIEYDRNAVVTMALSPSAPFLGLPHRVWGTEPAAKLLESWRAGDEQEQKETWTILKQALDKDRLGYRKLFS